LEGNYTEDWRARIPNSLLPISISSFLNTLLGSSFGVFVCQFEVKMLEKYRLNIDFFSTPSILFLLHLTILRSQVPSLHKDRCEACSVGKIASPGSAEVRWIAGSQHESIDQCILISLNCGIYSQSIRRSLDSGSRWVKQAMIISNIAIALPIFTIMIQ
jgi:hypothetical protein